MAYFFVLVQWAYACIAYFCFWGYTCCGMQQTGAAWRVKKVMAVSACLRRWSCVVGSFVFAMFSNNVVLCHV